MIIIDYFHLFIANILVLFPVVNPIGSAFIVNNSFLTELTHEEKKIILRKVARYAFLLCVGGLFVGKFLLALFGLSIPIIQIAGGAIICRNGWLFFFDEAGTTDDGKSDIPPERLKKMQFDYLSKNIFYPLTFPVVIGAGTFSVLMTLAANATTSTLMGTTMNFVVVVGSILAVCVLIYLIFVNIAQVQKYLGPEGNVVVKKLFSFFSICIGLKIITSGITEIAVVVFEKVKPLL